MNLLKKTTVILAAIAVFFIIYNTILLQNEKYAHTYTYYVFAALYLSTGVLMRYRTQLGIKIFTLLTWATTIYAGFIALGLVTQLAFSFLLLSLLFNPMAGISLAAQLLFLVGLVLYMHATKRALANIRFAQNGAIDARVVVDDKLPKWGRKGLVLAGIGLIVVSILSLPTLTKAALHGSDPSGGNSQEIEEYLEDKYGEKFTLSNFETSKQWRSSFESWQKIKADARPVKNPAITFEVSGCIENCEADDKFSDRYQYEYWAYSQRPVVEAKLKEVYGTVPEYKIQVGLSLAGSRQLPEKPLVEFKDIQTNPSYKPFIEVTTYQNGTFTKENIAESERRTREMTSFVKNLGMSKYSFTYTMKDPSSPAKSEYSGPEGVKQSDIHCSESLSIDDKEYDTMQGAINLKDFYHKGCSYKTSTWQGGGVARGVYPE